MTLTRKPGIQQNSSTRGPYPERLPEFPDDVKQRFPSMSAVQEQFSQWYFQLRSVLERMQAELQDLIDEAKSAGTSATTDVTALTNQLTALQASLTGLQNQMTALAATLNGLTDSSAAIAAVNAALAAHEADTSTHGIASTIVGETEEQPLSSKVLGLTEPRYGRFSLLMSGGVINPGEAFVVPVDYTMLIGDSLTVNGMLTINGGLKIL